jgi:ribonuclease HI
VAYINVYFDGASRGNPGQAGVGVVITDDNEDIISEACSYIGKKTNNQAEYLAVILALDLIVDNPKINQNDKISLIGDSQLVIKQLLGEYKVKNQKLKALHSQILEKIDSIGAKVEFIHINREKNTLADQMANKAIDENNKN